MKRMDVRLRRLEALTGMNDSDEKQFWENLQKEIEATLDCPIPFPDKVRKHQSLEQ